MPNTLNPVIPKLVARGLMALRQEARMPRLVRTNFDINPGGKFSTVTVPVSASVAVADVTPAATPPATGDTVLTEKSIVVDQWKEAAFYLTDQDMTRIDAEKDFLPLQASEAIKSIANFVDTFILGKLYKATYGYAGSAGVTPFAADSSAYSNTRKALNNQLAPMDPRFMVINTDAEANALNLRAFQDASFSGSIDGIVNGQINNKLGARWMMSQNMPTHTAGTGTGYLVNNGAGLAVGAKTAAVDTGSGTLLEGDLLTFAGHSQSYRVVSTVGGGTVTSITFEPGLVATVADNAAVTKIASHAVNLLFHPAAFHFVNKPFDGVDPMNLGNFFSAVDEVTGLALRLEVSREYKRTRWAYDILCGGEAIRPEFSARLIG